MNFANPMKPENFWQFQNAIHGIRDACLKFKIPVTGGNVSFYNESPQGPVHPTPAIGMVGLIAEERYITTSKFKNAGDLVCLLGGLGEGLGGSEYLWRIKKIKQGPLPKFDIDLEFRVQELIRALILKGIVQSAHDCSEGGLAVALAESSIQGRIGVCCQINENLRKDELLFGEAQSRIIVSIQEKNQKTVQELAKQFEVECVLLGRVGGENLTITLNKKNAVDHSVKDMEKAWRTSISTWMKKI